MQVTFGGRKKTVTFNGHSHSNFITRSGFWYKEGESCSNSYITWCSWVLFKLWFCDCSPRHLDVALVKPNTTVPWKLTQTLWDVSPPNSSPFAGENSCVGQLVAFCTAVTHTSTPTIIRSFHFPILHCGRRATSNSCVRKEKLQFQFLGICNIICTQTFESKKKVFQTIVPTKHTCVDKVACNREKTNLKTKIKALD